MRREGLRVFRALAAVASVVVGAGACAATAGASPAVKAAGQERAIELPPMIVAESSGAPAWLYVAAGDSEYLSRCSPATTRAFVTGHLEIARILQAFVPAEFWPATSVPTASIVVPLNQKAANDDAVSREMIRVEQQRGGGAGASDQRRIGGVQILPNLRLEDRDMRAVFTYVDEATFDAERLVAVPEFVHARLMRATPTLPQWFIEGVAGLYAQADFRQEPITLRPFTWVNREETAALQASGEGRRVLVAGPELFAADALTGRERAHEVRAAVWRAQVALFLRWCLDPANGAAGALWRFANRARVEPTTERMFRECFGFGYSDLRDRLSDYLPEAVTTAVRLDPGKLATLPRFEVAKATPAQVARLRGEWERLEVPYVRDQHPQFVSWYAEQALGGLRRAVGRGERDAQLAAVLGLCELEAGDPKLGRPYLEEAAARGVVRPRVHYEIARLRWEELTRGRPESERFTPAELGPVLAPLRIAVAQPPPLPEAYILMADAWLRATERASEAELVTLQEGARLFRRLPGVGFRVALLHARYGERKAAEELAVVSLAFIPEAESRKPFEALLAALRKAKTTGAQEADRAR